jgi:type I restriction enzyme, S subunit
MSKSFPMVPLGEVLVPVSRPEPVNPNKLYHILGAHWYAKGLYVKDIKSGSGIQANKVYRVELNDFVYNRLFAWKGSFAVATEENHGRYVSNEFPYFRIKQDRVDSQYLLRYFSRLSAWESAFSLSTGGTPTSRNRLKEEKLLAMKIPLPPLHDQQRIVARIEELTAKVEEARGLRREIESECDTLCRSILFPKSNINVIKTSMRDIVTLRKLDVVVSRDETYHFAGVYCFGKGVFKGQRKSGFEFAYTHLTHLRTNDFVYPKLMAWEGALGIVPPECDSLVVSPEFPVFELDQSRVLPEVLDVYFRTPLVWPTLSEASTGTNVRRRRLNPANFLDLKIPLPSMQIQWQLRDIKTKVDAIKQLQTETSAELDALLPSILDKAFKGEL